MRSYEAGVYDFYDDGGQLLKDAIPDKDDVPDFVKSASAVSQDSNNRLFALVMVDDGRVMKKFATADPGNTWLSALYFAFTKDNLPPEAQKTAAANIIEACEAFDIAAPDMLFDYADGPVGTNVVDVTSTRPMHKIASPATPQEGDNTYAIERADGSKFFPLQNASHVKAAMDYFERNRGEFVPRERREFAVKTAAAARRAGLDLPIEIEEYSGTGWNPSLEGHLTTRYLHLSDSGAPLETRNQLIKIASMVTTTDPEDMAEALEVFDREFGLDALWDKHISDPWYSITGHTKVAKGNEPEDETFTFGDTSVTGDEIVRFAERGLMTLVNHFGHDFGKAFQADPIKQFKALPLPQRKYLARMALNHQDSTGHG